MFKNKVVIVTGSSSGIGRETAKIFAREGANVVLHGQDETRLKEAEKEVQAISNAGKTLSIRGPIQDEKTWEKIANETIKKFGRIDVLVNNAGSKDDGKDANGLDCFTYCMEVNVKR
uniref:SDR family NAD(P)-dependent oxidoreductase n=1 Tax=Bursaphelenchus xylophilus TaxID=6326 RepID=A0A1I7SKC7_BURXY